MKKSDFEKLINKDLYQVFLFSSLCSLPICMGAHTWFVSLKNGRPSRWEVLMLKRLKGTHWGHLHLDAIDSCRGISILPCWRKYRWGGKLLWKTEGKKGSLAEQMVKFLDKSPKNYPYKKDYHFRGPNSNTFTRWVLNEFPEIDIKLPWNAVGKRYKAKK